MWNQQNLKIGNKFYYKIIKMKNPDEKILRLIEYLIFTKKVKNATDFCNEIGLLKTTLTRIKKGTSHFTVSQINTTCKKFNVNVNWIFGFESQVFRGEASKIRID